MTPLLRDEAFFEPAGDIESNLLKKRKNYESYIGKLRGSNCYKILPSGYLAMLDGGPSQYSARSGRGVQPGVEHWISRSTKEIYISNEYPLLGMLF